MIKISVIMPVYNSGKYLDIAVRSILTQSLRDIELILVDDGSTDGSSEQCDKYALQDSRVIVLHQQNGGICNARNNALKIAKGEYVAFSDHDDAYLPELLAKSYSEAKEFNADIVKFGKRYFHIYNDKLVRTIDNHLPNAVYSKADMSQHFFELYREKALACVWDGIYRRTLIINNNVWFDESYKHGGEDICFNMSLYPHANVFLFTPEVRYLHYVRYGFSTSSKFKPVLIDDAKRMTGDLLNGIRKFNINEEVYKVDIVQLFMYSYVDNIILLISNSLCNYSWQKKKSIMKNFLTSDIRPEYFFETKVSELWRKSKKDALSFGLLKNKMWFLLYMMFKIRIWQKSKTLLN